MELAVTPTSIFWWDSVYPQAGFVSCTVLEEWPNPDGEVLVRVSTNGRPESTVELTEFVVFKRQLSSGTPLLDSRHQSWRLPLQNPHQQFCRKPASLNICLQSSRFKRLVVTYTTLP